MAIVRCPRCRDEVTVPPRATRKALVRCPLCLEQYLLAEALANAPPQLVIIGGEVETSAIAAPDEHPEYRMAVPAHFEAPRAAVVFPRPVVQSRPRPRRQEKGGLVLLINYVVGGVMGLALGLLVLWWGFRKDPLELGPPFAQYVPWIVPVQFQGKLNGQSATLPSENASSAKPKAATNPSVAANPNQPQNELASLLEFSEPATLTQDNAPIDEPTHKPLMPDLRDLLPDGPPDKAQPSP